MAAEKSTRKGSKLNENSQAQKSKTVKITDFNTAENVDQ